jgi:cold shock CspA family protein
MSSDSPDRKIGNVKWFNNKAGYGFITIGENTDSPQDVFVHYTNIRVGNEQYKYLVQGEYVEFVLTATPDGPHAFQATSVTGIQGGATLCERRKQTRDAAPPQDEVERPVRKPRSPAPRRILRREESQQQQEDKDDGFTTVQKKQVRRTA